jgi:hypothetical protein
MLLFESGILIQDARTRHLLCYDPETEKLDCIDLVVPLWAYD